jgi:hypothetical protein
VRPCRSQAGVQAWACPDKRKPGLQIELRPPQHPDRPTRTVPWLGAISQPPRLHLIHPCSLVPPPSTGRVRPTWPKRCPQPPQRSGRSCERIALAGAMIPSLNGLKSVLRQSRPRAVSQQHRLASAVVRAVVETEDMMAPRQWRPTDVRLAVFSHPSGRAGRWSSTPRKGFGAKARSGSTRGCDSSCRRSCYAPRRSPAEEVVVDFVPFVVRGG